jgi:hypothetical protein
VPLLDGQAVNLGAPTCAARPTAIPTVVPLLAAWVVQTVIE